MAVQFNLIFFIIPDLLIFKISIKNQAHRRFSQKKKKAVGITRIPTVLVEISGIEPLTS